MQAESKPAGLLRTYALLIAAVTVLTIAGAVAVSLTRPAPYVSDARVVVQPERVRGGGTPLPPDMGTEREIAVSGAVAQNAAEQLDRPIGVASDNLQVEVPVDTNVLEFSYSANSAEAALEGAQVFTQAYVEYRNGPRSVVAQIISPPSLPTEPSRPNLYLIIALGIMVGLGLGIAIAYAWDRLSPRLRDVADVEAQTGLPVLASIPTLPASTGERIVVGSMQATAGAQAYGHLTARLLSLLQQYDAHILMITSPAAGAGKTTVTLNLALSLAAAGKETVVVSANPHDAALWVQAGVMQRPGLQELLQEEATLGEALHATDIEDLHVVPAGGSSKVALPALNIGRLTDVLDELRQKTEVVLIEAPSVLGAADTAILAELADLTLLVVDIRRGRRADASAAVRALSHVESRLTGCVVNDPGRKTKPPEEPQPAPTFRLVGRRRRTQSKDPSSTNEGNQNATPTSIHSKNVKSGARRRTGRRSAGADNPTGPSGAADDRIADVQ
jgi:Mrp family chromosome partitioning ATPase